MKLTIYGMLDIHTPTRLVERGVRRLKEKLLTHMKAGDKFSKKRSNTGNSTRCNEQNTVHTVKGIRFRNRLRPRTKH